MKKVVYPGTFDPFTNGHLDIVTRALGIFDELTVLVATPPHKKSVIAKEKIVELIQETLKDYSNVTVDLWDGLTTDYLKNKNIQYIVRGLRPTGDFEIEFQLASMNKDLLPGVETIFLTATDKYYYTSSSLIREIHSHGGDISSYVPSNINRYLKSNSEK